MRPDIKHILQDRLQGHEAPVDPGVWRAIQSKLATAAPASDPVEDLFRDRLGEHQVDPGPGTWEAISSQLGHTVAGTTAGGGMLGWAAAGLGVVIVAAGLYLATGDDREQIAALPQVENEVTVTMENIPVTTIETNALPEITAGNVAVENMEAAEMATDPPIQDQVVRSPRMKKPAPASAPIERSEEDFSVHPKTSTPPEQNGANTTASDKNANGTLVADKVTPARTEEGPALVEQIIQKMIVEAEEKAEVESPALEDIPSLAERSDIPTADDLQVEAISEAPLPKLFLPNTFTPNRDGLNDEYIVSGEGFSQIAVSIISVVDGQQVFKSNDARIGWNGATCPNGDCAVGHYIVAVEAITDDGRPVTKSQVVWLMR